MSSELAFWDAVGDIRESDDRFHPQSYAFLMQALSHTVQGFSEERREDPQRRHLSGRELLEGMTRLARDEFGPLAPMVFAEWGVRSSEDVGEMVFHLVTRGQLSARPEDTLEDFRGYDLAGRLVSDADASPAA